MEILQTIYTPVVWDHLVKYDKELNLSDTNTPKHLWQYFVPYFAQDGMIAYNPLRKAIKNAQGETVVPDDAYITEAELIANSQTLSTKYKNPDNENLNAIAPYSIFNVLDLLRQKNYKDLVVTDAVRVNMLYGSPYDYSQKNDTTYISDKFTGSATESDYQRIIDDFKWLIETATQKKISSGLVQFDGDGQGILNKLIEPDLKQIDSAIMYNGDALDAYFSEGNYSNVPDGSIDAIKINKNVLLVDGLVLANGDNNGKNKNDAWDSIEDKFYESLRNSFYQNLGTIYTKYYSKDNSSPLSMDKKQQAYIDYATDFYKNYLDIVLKDSFDQQNQQKYEEFKNSLASLYNLTSINIELMHTYDDFADLWWNDEVIKNAVLDAYLKANPENTADSFDKTALISFVNHIDLANELFYAYMEENSLNLINFDFVNYTPATYFEYELMKRNYFFKEGNELDQKVINIYEIKDEPEKGITHTNVAGVSEKLLSQIGTYYFKTFKN
ncbi:hypothetical protein [Mycoplasma nasistruthionis]|uniref:Uncharacterized protein n=1 Tax=Mycoplasma nasistruthionis TaxID=353852 RepID=A0A5B7XV23_9MOLU|nr:hypothetical protein [Mycoplasma nasistruthionis]QCZ36781.1 hypothetical protein FG904_02040 [Mycoplasma nasistruthionis]